LSVQLALWYFLGSKSDAEIVSFGNRLCMTFCSNFSRCDLIIPGTAKSLSAVEIQSLGLSNIGPIPHGISRLNADEINRCGGGAGCDEAEAQQAEDGCPRLGRTGEGEIGVLHFLGILDFPDKRTIHIGEFLATWLSQVNP